MRNKSAFWLVPCVLFAAVAAGQLIRFEIFPEGRGAVLLLDIVSITLNFVLIISLLWKKRLLQYLRFVWSNHFWRYLALFVIWALVALSIRYGWYTKGELLTAFSYWVRLALFTNLAACFGFMGETKQTVKYFLLWGAIAIIVGFLQLIFVGNFAFMTGLGWDPHVGRLLSTFFDPNYFGAFIVLIMAVSLNQALHKDQNLPRRLGYLALLAVAWVALYFTYSRTGWLMGAITLFLTALRANWKISLATFAVFAIVLLFPNRLSGRIVGISSFFSRSSYTSNLNQGVQGLDQSTTDASAAARALSLRRGWELVKKYPITGVGYNAYGYALVRNGIASKDELSNLSLMGSDSSFLNVFATTGIIGLLLYLMFYFSLLKSLFISWWQRSKTLAAPIFGFTVALLAGSIFNNLLFYLPLAISWLVLEACVKDES